MSDRDINKLPLVEQRKLRRDPLYNWLRVDREGKPGETRFVRDGDILFDDGDECVFVTVQPLSSKPCVRDAPVPGIITAWRMRGVWDSWPGQFRFTVTPLRCVCDDDHDIKLPPAMFDQMIAEVFGEEVGSEGLGFESPANLIACDLEDAAREHGDCSSAGEYTGPMIFAEHIPDGIVCKHDYWANTEFSSRKHVTRQSGLSRRAA